jgi:hypothetical protein
MDKDKLEILVNFLKIASMLATGGFGALGLLTKYKDDTGKITKWGKLALTGIVFSSISSMSLFILESSINNSRAKDARLRAEAQESELKEILKTARSTVVRQEENLRTTNTVANDMKSSIEAQRKLLGQNTLISQDLRSSIEKQIHTLNTAEVIAQDQRFSIKRQEELLGKTLEGNANISRSLNPLTPITFSMTFEPQYSMERARPLAIAKQFVEKWISLPVDRRRAYEQTSPFLDINIYPNGANEVRKPEEILIRPKPLTATHSGIFLFDTRFESSLFEEISTNTLAWIRIYDRLESLDSIPEIKGESFYFGWESADLAYDVWGLPLSHLITFINRPELPKIKNLPHDLNMADKINLRTGAVTESYTAVNVKPLKRSGNINSTLDLRDKFVVVALPRSTYEDIKIIRMWLLIGEGNSHEYILDPKKINITKNEGMILISFKLNESYFLKRSDLSY